MVSVYYCHVFLILTSVTNSRRAQNMRNRASNHKPGTKRLKSNVESARCRIENKRRRVEGELVPSTSTLVPDQDSEIRFVGGRREREGGKEGGKGKEEVICTMYVCMLSIVRGKEGGRR